jgi:hypothetical protein
MEAICVIGRGCSWKPLLLETVRAARDAVGPHFPVAVKLNSADFQKGGFAFEESLQVARWLQDAGIDLLEISGGTYEQPKLLGLAGFEAEEKQPVARSTLLREAYFVDFALAMQAAVTVPLMVTGGFRTRAAMEQAIETGAADLIGLARPMCVDTDAPAQLLAGAEELQRYEEQLSLLPDCLSFLQAIPALRSVSGFAVIYWFYTQLDMLGRSGTTQPDMSVLTAALRVMGQQKKLLKER